MKSIYALAFFLFFSHVTYAQSTVCFDKKFRVIKDCSKAKYIVDLANGSPSRIINQSTGRAIAEGTLHESDTLSFDGKVSFFNDNMTLKGIRFYKKGVQVPAISVNSALQKNTSSKSGFYMLVGEDGEFCVYNSTSYSGQFYEWMAATGKITDTVTLTLEDFVKTYDIDGQVLTIQKYSKGKIAPFIATTSDYNQPYEIIKIVTHTTINYRNIDDELEKFKIKCQLMGADGAVGIHTSESLTPAAEFCYTQKSLIIQGTAFRLKKTE